MRKIIGLIFVLVSFGFWLLLPSVTYADNVTAVSSDNFTIGFTANLTSVQDAFTAASEAHAYIIAANQLSIFNSVLGAILVLFINILAYWHKERWLYVLAGFAFILYGFSYFSTNSYIGILLVLAGLYNFVIKAWLQRA